MATALSPAIIVNTNRFIRSPKLHTRGILRNIAINSAVLVNTLRQFIYHFRVLTCDKMHILYVH